jgi:nitrite reductase/ring-hydroxylating ferredoxin subunit
MTTDPTSTLLPLVVNGSPVAVSIHASGIFNASSVPEMWTYSRYARMTSPPLRAVKVSSVAVAVARSLVLSTAAVMAVVCREDEISGIGDHFIYNVAGLSYIIVRTAENNFKAFKNVCLHRGRKLVDGSGCGASHFKCAYHAWTWLTLSL